MDPRSEMNYESRLPPIASLYSPAAPDIPSAELSERGGDYRLGILLQGAYTHQAVAEDGVLQCVVLPGALGFVAAVVQLYHQHDVHVVVAQQEIHMLGADLVEPLLPVPGALFDGHYVRHPDFRAYLEFQPVRNGAQNAV